jgi:hypothetical protein
MGIHLIDAVHAILDRVKKETGKNVEFIEKNDLTTYAALKMARKNMTSHIIVYKKKHDEIINHLVAHECGHILRMFAVPEEKRLIPYSDDVLKLKALEQIETEITVLSKVLPFEQLAGIINLWYTGIIRQVTNHPPDIMIERWLYNDYPTLRPYQKKSIEKQLNESLEGLNAAASKITPKTILEASNIMNYAFFRMLGLHFGTNFIRPYNNTTYVNRGKELAAVIEKEYIDTYEGDIQMANRWAQLLGLADWFKWRDFEDIPQGYINAT